MLIDRFNRVHDYLRIAITDQCNFRCSYCMPSGGHICTSRSQLMSAQELRTIAGEFVRHGVKKIRLTGGEPLLRKDFGEILFQLADLGVELLLTTNGSLLHKHIQVLKEAGVRSVNVSLDSLSASTFKAITLKDQFHRVWKNIELLLLENIRIKLNVVAIRGLIEPEIVPFIQLTKDLPVHVRFIEFMPFSHNNWSKNMVITADEICQIAARRFGLCKLEDEPNATAKKFAVAGHKGTIAFITAMSCQFCNGCNRLRITSEGKLKNCLFGKEEFDIAGALRRRMPLLPLIMQALGSKAEAMGGQFTRGYKLVNPELIRNRTMVKIGG